MSRQRLILFILLILLVVVVIWSYLSYPRLKTVSPMKYPPGSHIKADKKRPAIAASPQVSKNDERVLRLDLLNQEQPAFKGYRRNIFKPVFVDELKVMKQTVVAKPVRPPVQAQKPAPDPLPAAATGTAPRELARFTFLGFLKKNNHKTIFLAKDKDIILVKKGNTFANRYQASSITDQALTILVTDTGEEIVIPLIENQPLGMAAK